MDVDASISQSKRKNRTPSNANSLILYKELYDRITGINFPEMYVSMRRQLAARHIEVNSSVGIMCQTRFFMEHGLIGQYITGHKTSVVIADHNLSAEFISFVRQALQRLLNAEYKDVLSKRHLRVLSEKPSNVQSPTASPAKEAMRKLIGAFSEAAPSDLVHAIEKILVDKSRREKILTVLDVAILRIDAVKLMLPLLEDTLKSLQLDDYNLLTFDEIIPRLAVLVDLHYHPSYSQCKLFAHLSAPSAKFLFTLLTIVFCKEVSAPEYTLNGPIILELCTPLMFRYFSFMPMIRRRDFRRMERRFSRQKRLLIGYYLCLPLLMPPEEIADDLNLRLSFCMAGMFEEFTELFGLNDGPFYGFVIPHIYGGHFLSPYFYGAIEYMATNPELLEFAKHTFGHNMKFYSFLIDALLVSRKYDVAYEIIAKTYLLVSNMEERMRLLLAEAMCLTGLKKHEECIHVLNTLMGYLDDDWLMLEEKINISHWNLQCFRKIRIQDVHICFTLLLFCNMEALFEQSNYTNKHCALFLALCEIVRGAIAPPTSSSNFNHPYPISKFDVFDLGSKMSPPDYAFLMNALAPFAITEELLCFTAAPTRLCKEAYASLCNKIKCFLAPSLSTQMFVIFKAFRLYREAFEFVKLPPDSPLIKPLDIPNTDRRKIFFCQVLQKYDGVWTSEFVSSDDEDDKTNEVALPNIESIATFLATQADAGSRDADVKPSLQANAAEWLRAVDLALQTNKKAKPAVATPKTEPAHGSATSARTLNASQISKLFGIPIQPEHCVQSMARRVRPRLFGTSIDEIRALANRKRKPEPRPVIELDKRHRLLDAADGASTSRAAGPLPVHQPEPATHHSRTQRIREERRLEQLTREQYYYNTFGAQWVVRPNGLLEKYMIKKLGQCSDIKPEDWSDDDMRGIYDHMEECDSEEEENEVVPEPGTSEFENFLDSINLPPAQRVP